METVAYVKRRLIWFVICLILDRRFFGVTTSLHVQFFTIVGDFSAYEVCIAPGLL